MRTVDETIAAYEAGETWNDDDEVVELDVRRPLDKVIPVRLNADQWAAVRREAQELGIGPSTLIRMWVLEQLRGRLGAAVMKTGDATRRNQSPARAARDVREAAKTGVQRHAAKEVPR